MSSEDFNNSYCLPSTLIPSPTPGRPLAGCRQRRKPAEVRLPGPMLSGRDSQSTGAGGRTAVTSPGPQGCGLKASGKLASVPVERFPGPTAEESSSKYPVFLSLFHFPRFSGQERTSEEKPLQPPPRTGSLSGIPTLDVGKAPLPHSHCQGGMALPSAELHSAS